jgi:hypothetical protein
MLDVLAGPDGELPEEIRGMEPKLVERVSGLRGGGRRPWVTFLHCLHQVRLQSLHQPLHLSTPLVLRCGKQVCNEVLDGSQLNVQWDDIAGLEVCHLSREQ